MSHASGWRVPLNDLASQHAPLHSQLQDALDQVVRDSQFILGEPVARLEQSMACLVGTKHAIGVSSGTDALTCSLVALGIGQDDEVVTTPFTFVATVESIVRVGARPRFADVRWDTLNLDPDAVEAALTSKTKAILAVHLYGQPAELDRLSEIADRYGLALVEDAAQALGATYRGCPVGTWGQVGCFSFFPAKPLGALGDGGLVVTSSDELAQRCRMLRAHGARHNNEHVLIGGNSRLDALQAAFLQVKLPHLEQWLAARRAWAHAYDRALRNVRGLRPAQQHAQAISAYACYTVLVPPDRRDRLAQDLKVRGIATAIYYRRPVHRQVAYAPMWDGRPLPNSEAAADCVLSLPIFPCMSQAQHSAVVEAVRDGCGVGSLSARE